MNLALEVEMEKKKESRDEERMGNMVFGTIETGGEEAGEDEDEEEEKKRARAAMSFEVVSEGTSIDWANSRARCSHV